MHWTDGAVYATQKQPLINQISELLNKASAEDIQGEILAITVPNTNLVSVGSQAAGVFKALIGRHYDTVILISPSHTGPFKRINICRVDSYSTPLGDLQVNDKVRNELCDEDDDIFLDDTGHYQTEGIDVQLPFLQQILTGFDVVPIVMGDESPEFCRELGNAIGEVIYNRRTLVVAAVDIVEASQEGLDDLKRLVETRDVSRLMSLLNSETVRMKGKGALLVALIAALHRNADSSKVLSLTNPGIDVPGVLGTVIWRS